MNCKICGSEYSEGMTFCQNCGANLKSPQTETREPLPQNPQSFDFAHLQQKVKSTSYGKKINFLANVIFGFYIFFSLIIIIAGGVSGFILAENIAYGDYEFILIIGGVFIASIILAVLNVIAGYIVKVFLSSYGVIVSWHENN